MIVYLVTVFLIMIFSINMDRQVIGVDSRGRHIYNGKGQLMIFLCIAVLTFVSGFRWNVGTDFSTYISMYGRLKHDWINMLGLFDEPGIAVLAKISSEIYDSPVIMILLSALITVFLNVITLKKYSVGFQISILFYIFIGAWHGSFNGIRQYLAAAILFAGHRFIYEKKFFKYVAVVLVAMLFHRTAIVMLPVYFLGSKKISLKSISVVAITVLVIRYSYDYLFEVMSFFKGSDQSEYSYMTSDVNAIRILVAFAPLLIAVLARKTAVMRDNETQFYVMMLIINAGFMFGTSGSAYLARVGIYTDMYATLAFPKLIGCFKKESRKMALLLILGLYFVFWVYELYARGLLEFSWSFGRLGI